MAETRIKKSSPRNPFLFPLQLCPLFHSNEKRERDKKKSVCVCVCVFVCVREREKQVCFVCASVCKTCLTVVDNPNLFL